MLLGSSFIHQIIQIDDHTETNKELMQIKIGRA